MLNNLTEAQTRAFNILKELDDEMSKMPDINVEKIMFSIHWIRKHLKVPEIIPFIKLFYFENEGAIIDLLETKELTSH